MAPEPAVATAWLDALPSRNRPGLFATPLAWAVADFTRGLIERAGDLPRDHVGLIVASDECSLATIHDLSRAAQEGQVSPLRFAGSSPSIVAGLAALEQHIRGPTLCLTMQPRFAAEAILALIHYWMRHNRIEAVIVVAHVDEGGDRHRLKGLVARSLSESLRGDVLELVDCGAE